MKFGKKETEIEGSLIIAPQVFGDERGFFMESYNKREFQKLGIKKDFVQDNLSQSSKGVLRGLHFQIHKPQAKLVTVLKGSVYDVIVDLREGSPSFKHYIGVKLTEENKKMLYIPEGCAHGFLTLTKEVLFNYKVTDYYYADYDGGIIWNDPDIMIEWPFEKYNIKTPILSEKDSKLPRLKDIKISFSS